jgi:hypothetical protein
MPVTVDSRHRCDGFTHAAATCVTCLVWPASWNVHGWPAAPDIVVTPTSPSIELLVAQAGIQVTYWEDLGFLGIYVRGETACYAALDATLRLPSHRLRRKAVLATLLVRHTEGWRTAIVPRYRISLEQD